jgi:hypothetical protein
MSHIYRCISIAQEVCGAKFTVITKGATYVGCVIEGEFSIRMYGREYKAGGIDQELKKVNLLDSQAQELCDLLNAGVDINDAPVYHFVKTDFLKSRIALRSWNMVDPNVFHSSDTIDKARGILASMEFNDVFGVPTQAMLSAAVTFMSTGIYAGISEYPAFLGGGVLHSNSRTWDALSMFGPRVPTCNVGDKKGTLITFPGAGKEDKNLVRVAGVRPLHYFPFWILPIGQAVPQWDKMINEGLVSFPRGRKGKKEFTDLHRVVLTVSSDPGFTDMYNMIKGMAEEARTAGISGQKRKRGSQDEDKKGKKAKVDAGSSDI